MGQQTAESDDEQADEPTGADPDGTTHVATGTVEGNTDSDPDGDDGDSDVLTIRVTDMQLTGNRDNIERIEDRLEKAVGSVLREDFGVQMGGFRTRVGHEYAQISDNCPRCGSMLDVFELTPDCDNGAYATVECCDEGCEFWATAVYRLIDFERFNP